MPSYLLYLFKLSFIGKFNLIYATSPILFSGWQLNLCVTKQSIIINAVKIKGEARNRETGQKFNPYPLPCLVTSSNHSYPARNHAKLSHYRSNISVLSVHTCLVPKPHYCAHLMRFSSNEPSESSGRTAGTRQWI